MNPGAYIQERLARLSRRIEVPSFANDSELGAFIAKALLSKKFRKYAVDADTLPHIESALKLNFKKQEPVKLVMPFGGYKLWRLDEAPEADWAELFSLMYYAAWLSPIAAAYEPGIWFDFSSDDVVVERLNNIPKADTAAYKASFEAILTFLEQHLPENMRFTFTPVGSRYASKAEFDAELDEKMTAWLAENGEMLPVPTEREKTMMDLNAKRTPEDLADPEWYGKNKLMHDVYLGMSKRRPYTRTPDKILAFTKALPKGIAVGTTKTSIAKFWAGAGAIERRGDSYIETVLSPEQLKAAEAEWIPTSLPGLAGKNFQKIRIV